jgi:hypothetical protein
VAKIETFLARLGHDIEMDAGPAIEAVAGFLPPPYSAIGKETGALIVMAERRYGGASGATKLQAVLALAEPVISGAIATKGHSFTATDFTNWLVTGLNLYEEKSK